MSQLELRPGLADVPVAESAISFIDGKRALLAYRGIAAETLAPLLTVIEYVAVVPPDVLVTAGVLVDLATVRAGTHSAPDDDPGTAAGVAVRTAPGFPPVAP